MPRVVDRLIRDHVRYTGDGLPGEPVNAPLPIGDPASGVYNPTKRDIREAIGGVEGDRIRAEAAAELAQAAMVDAQGVTLQAASLTALLANTAASYPVGTIFATRAEGYSYEVVASGGDEVTAGGVRLRRLRRDYETGHTVNLAGAQQPTDPGFFGGNFLNLKSGQVIDWQSPADTDVEPKFAFGVTASIVGGHANGPDHARGGVWLKIEKDNALTTTQPGEIDGMYMQIRQGRKDDAGGILILAEKVFTGAADDTGGLTPMEISGAKINASGQETRRVHFIPAFMEGQGGATNGNGSGIYLEAHTGAIDSGIHVIGRSESGAEFANILVAATTRNPASRYFQISGLGEMFMGSPTNQMSMVYDQGIAALRWKNSPGNVALMSLDQAGALNAFGGFYSTVISPSRLRSAADTVNTVGKQLGLLRFDGTEWVFASGAVPNSPWRKVADPNVIAHQPV